MNRINSLLILSCMFYTLALPCSAQNVNSQRLKCYPSQLSQNKNLNAVPHTQSSPYWYNDFSNPSDWILSNTSNPARDWQISSTPLPFIGVLNSSSGGNFAGFDSDSDGPNSTQDASIRILNPIDCSPLTEVQISFEQVYMHFNDDVYVEVSKDSINWTLYPVNTNVPVNQMTQNPDLISVDISTTASNEPKVWIGFRFVGSWDYAWAVDDITIQAPPDNDLKLTSTFFKGTSIGNPTITDSSWSKYYTRIPFSQAVYDTLIMGGEITNNGIVTQPNTRLVTKITGALFYSDSSTMSNLVPGNTIFPEITSSYFIPYVTGSYNVTFTAKSDSTDAAFIDNVISTSFQITDTVYARDNGVFGNGYGNAGKWTCGNIFHIYTADSITSLGFAFHSSTTPGAKVNFMIYDTTDLSNPLKSITNYTLSGNDIGNWLTIHLDTPLIVSPGVYLASFQQLNDSDNVSIITGQNAQSAPPLTTFIDLNNDGNWAYSSFIPFIRMYLTGNTCPEITSVFSVIDADCDSANGSATANPSGGISPYTYEWDANTGNQTAQTATGLSAGVYFVTITDSIGCTGSMFAIINNSSTPSVSDSINNASCYGECDGMISLDVSGNSPFTYLWSNNSTIPAISGLCPNIYFVTITDSLGCKGVFSYTVTQPPELLLSLSQTPDYGSGTGTASANASGGTPPYTYQWDANTGNQTTQTATGLSGGNYSVTVTDSSGCIISNNIIVTEVPYHRKLDLINIYPNPATDHFTIDIYSPSTQDYKMLLYNNLGDIIFTTHIKNKSHFLMDYYFKNDIKGLYFISVATEKRIIIKKIIRF